MLVINAAYNLCNRTWNITGSTVGYIQIDDFTLTNSAIVLVSSKDKNGATQYGVSIVGGIKFQNFSANMELRFGTFGNGQPTQTVICIPCPTTFL